MMHMVRTFDIAPAPRATGQAFEALGRTWHARKWLPRPDREQYFLTAEARPKVDDEALLLAWFAELLGHLVAEDDFAHAVAELGPDAVDPVALSELRAWLFAVVIERVAADAEVQGADPTVPQSRPD